MNRTMNGKEIIELCTFPDDDKDYCKIFTVRKSWLLGVLESLEEKNNQNPVDLENFLENYCWDETWFIYLYAKFEDMLISEEEQS